MTCREKYRLNHIIGLEPIAPNIHYQFGSVIHTMCQSYWNGEDYMTAFTKALKLSQELDPRLCDAKDQKKYTDLCETIAPITSIYYKTNGEAGPSEKPIYNEYQFSWDWGTISGIHVICTGTIDRYFPDGTLRDTKTASAVGKDWKSDLKKRLLREPQLPFYRRFIEYDNGRIVLDESKLPPVEKMQYEVIVKPYRGSEPSIEILDCTKEFMARQEVWDQQTDWAIREIAEFYANALDSQPWPQSTSACTTSIFGECDYLPVCLGNKLSADTTLYRIREKEEVKV